MIHDLCSLTNYLRSKYSMCDQQLHIFFCWLQNHKLCLYLPTWCFLVMQIMSKRHIASWQFWRVRSKCWSITAKGPESNGENMRCHNIWNLCHMIDDTLGPSWFSTLREFPFQDFLAIIMKYRIRQIFYLCTQDITLWVYSLSFLAKSTEWETYLWQEPNYSCHAHGRARPITNLKSHLLNPSHIHSICLTC